jgi:hypothetical protein
MTRADSFHPSDRPHVRWVGMEGLLALTVALIVAGSCWRPTQEITL